MIVKLKYLLIAWGVIIVLLLWALTAHGSLDSRVTKSLTGGAVSTKSHSLWQLHQYKDTTLLRKSPLCWTPYHSFVEVWYHVKVYSGENKNWLEVDTNLIDLLLDEAQFNRSFAQHFRVSGNRKHKVWLIYRWCKRTRYTVGKKYAKDVFQTRQGDCAAISAAFYVLCKAKKIPVRYVIGWTKSGCHAWNRVKVSGRWYWIDCTFGYWLQQEQFDGRTVMELW